MRTYPRTELYDLQQTLTSLGIGEAIVTGLDPRGVPTPVIATRLAPPTSRMAPLTAEEFQKEFAESDLMREYGKPVDRESAAEMLARRLEEGESGKKGEAGKAGDAGERESRGTTGKTAGGGLLGALTGPTARSITRELIRGVFGILKGKAPRRTTRSRW